MNFFKSKYSWLIFLVLMFLPAILKKQEKSTESLEGKDIPTADFEAMGYTKGQLTAMVQSSKAYKDKLIKR